MGEEASSEQRKNTACVTEVDDQLRHTMAYANDVKLFGKWSYDEIEVRITTRARESIAAAGRRARSGRNSPPSVGALRRGGGWGGGARFLLLEDGRSPRERSVCVAVGEVSLGSARARRERLWAESSSERTRLCGVSRQGHPPFPYFFSGLRGANLFF